MTQQFNTKEQALQKAKHYCAYQERCHKEVKDKLYELGLHKNEVEEVLADLIQENYLNEERFAIHFAGGRFRVKQWGKMKIKYELKQKQVSTFCINKALGEIDEVAYIATLHKLLAEKLKTLSREKNIFIKKKKAQDFLLQKGFEITLIRTAIEKNC